MKYSLAFCTIFIANMVIAEPLAALVTFSNFSITMEGISKQIQYQELFIRAENSVWTQRVLPDAIAKHHHRHYHHDEHEHRDYHDLNFSLAGRWIELDNNSQPRFRLVVSPDKIIVEPRVNEYGTLGFDGDWETAYYHVNRATLNNMLVLKKSAPQHSLWYEKRNEKLLTRILWDAKNEIPLVIERSSLDGNSQQKIIFKTVAVPQQLPWQALTDHQTIAYEDLLD